MNSSRYEYWKKGMFWYWHLISANGRIIIQSEGYWRRAGCINGIKSLASNEWVWNGAVSADGRFYFIARTRNNKIIGTSQMYKSKHGRQKGAASVRKNCGSIVVQVHRDKRTTA